MKKTLELVVESRRRDGFLVPDRTGGLVYLARRRVVRGALKAVSGHTTIVGFFSVPSMPKSCFPFFLSYFMASEMEMAIDDTMMPESNPVTKGAAMAKSSFEHMKRSLEEACEFLRSFTLGRHGFTQQDGIAGIQRVTERCNRMEKLFADEPDAKESKAVVASARSRVLAAKARLELLRSR